MDRSQQPGKAVGSGQPRAGFADAFDTLRAILEPYASRRAFQHSEAPGKYQLSSTTMTDRSGRPLFIASV